MSERPAISRSFVDLEQGEELKEEINDKHWFAILKNNLRYSYLNQSDSLLASLLSYGKVSFEPPTSSVVMLGKAYVDPFSQSPLEEHHTLRGTLRELTQAFDSDFRSVIWCTYRSGFPPIRRIEDGELKCEFTSDVGWGCTLRVAQMLIANALLRVHHTREQSLRFVLDTPAAPFSIYNLVDTGDRYLNRRAGDWYAPSAACHALKYLLDEHPELGISMVIAMDGCVYCDQVYAAAAGTDISQFRLKCTCEKKVRVQDPVPSSEDYEVLDFEDQECSSCYIPMRADQWRHPLLLTVPLMLGLGQVNPEYYECIKFFLRLPQTIGIIGGRPKSALYFVGYQKESLIFLDPHYVQKAVFEDCCHPTFVCERANLLRLRDAESSMSVAFYIEDLSSFDRFCQCLRENEDLTKRVITVQPRTPGYQLGEDLPTVSVDQDFIVIDR